MRIGPGHATTLVITGRPPRTDEPSSRLRLLTVILFNFNLLIVKHLTKRLICDSFRWRLRATKATRILRARSVGIATRVIGHRLRAFSGCNDRDNGNRCGNSPRNTTSDGRTLFRVQITDRNLVQF